MRSEPKAIGGKSSTESEQHFMIDGCKVTVRYNEEDNPRCASEIRSLLLAARFPPENHQ